MQKDEEKYGKQQERGGMVVESEAQRQRDCSKGHGISYIPEWAKTDEFLGEESVTGGSKSSGAQDPPARQDHEGAGGEKNFAGKARPGWKGKGEGGVEAAKMEGAPANQQDGCYYFE
jgi:hypothetical protein